MRVHPGSSLHIRAVAYASILPSRQATRGLAALFQVGQQVKHHADCSGWHLTIVAGYKHLWKRSHAPGRQYTAASGTWVFME